MLELKNITKVYKTNGLVSKALDDVSLNFREYEFASILGPSGSGKTTLLNIIGGLDHYTTGNLKINETSTKKYKDADWDSYRNHRIGFVFQSYNLISHQTILKNVSLALTLSGVSKKETTKKAKKALKEVGLEKHLNKRPNQLSGGQMQRVAIARALVNDPDIILADEPTGALDSETSVQIMNLLKKISEKKLIIMVTHNPELAEEYSTRIINLKDGKIISDSNPYDGKINTKESLGIEKKKFKKTKMSRLTAFALSFNNLMTKKARTILVAVAGSIGIIGIALILALSNGFQRYVDSIEEDALTSYPLMIMQETSDMTSVLLSAAAANNQEPQEGIVRENQILTDTLSSLSVNDLKSFKEYLEQNSDKYQTDVSNISYNYSIDPLIYTNNEQFGLMKLNPANLFGSILGGSSTLLSSYSSYTSIFSQLPSSDKAELENNYQLLAGRLPENYNEMILNLKDPNSISELLVYSLGFRDIEDLKTMITKIMSGETVEKLSEPMQLSYEDLLNVELKLIKPAELYQYNSEYNIYEDMSENSDFMKNLYNNSETLKIVGITTSNEDSGLLSASSSGIFYSKDLISHIVDSASNTEIVKKQLENDDIDVFSGKRFDEKSDSLGLDFASLVKVDEEKLKNAFDIKIDQSEIQTKVSSFISEISENLTTDITPGKTAFLKILEELLNDFVQNLPVEININDIDSLVDSYMNTYDPNKKIYNLTEEYIIPTDIFKTAYSGFLKGFLGAYFQAYSFYIEQYQSIAGMPPKFVIEHPEYFSDPTNLTIEKDDKLLEPTKTEFLKNEKIQLTIEEMAHAMTEAQMKKNVLTEVGNLTTYLTDSFANAFNINPDAIASAFQLNVSEEQITRIISAMMTKTESTAKSNLISLGYQNQNDPTSIYIYFSTFDGKENFMNLIDKYNEEVGEEKEIKYSDTTGFLMSSVKTIVDAVTYVLIGFVSISLVVSSIMIGVITYISVYERTKEIGILRAIGASRRNISSIFNAETFIIGLLSGILAMIISYSVIPLINAIILHFTDIEHLSAYLSAQNTIILVFLSVILTLIGGLIPAKSASKKDPVESLRTE